MDKKRESQIIHDYETSAISYRSLGKKYGVSASSVFRLLKSKRKRDSLTADLQPSKSGKDILPGDEKALRERLRKLELENELLNLMLDISSRELGVDLRKKPGTKRSK